MRFHNMADLSGRLFSNSSRDFSSEGEELCRIVAELNILLDFNFSWYRVQGLTD